MIKKLAGLLALAGCFFAASAQTITPITWNVVGLDSNNVSVGPDVFPVGVRVCNTTASTLTGYSTRFVWDTTSSYINRTSSEFLVVPSLTPGACQDVFHEVTVTRDAAAYDQKARYHINLINGGSATVASTPSPREIYVEHLISQNRNSVDAISVDGTPVTLGSGSVALNEGQTYTIRLDGHTATQGYEQFEQFIGLNPALFTIKSVKSTYTSAAGTDLTALSKLYADGCGWINDPTDVTDPAYRQCSSTGKYGGTTSVTYVVKVNAGAAIARPSGERAYALLYDFSGSSYHYNGDYNDGITFTFTSSPPPVQVDLAISKVGNLASPGNGTFTLSVTNTSTIDATGVSVIDSVPIGYNIKNPSSQATPPRGSVNWVTSNPESLTWTVGNLAAGETLSYTFEVQTVNNQSNYLNQACVSGTQTDPNTSNNCATAQVPLEQADLVLSKSATYTPPLKIDDALSFVIKLVNLGPAVATGVVVQDTLPAGYSYVSHTCATGWTASSSGPARICTAQSDVAVGSTPLTVLTINAIAVAPANPTVLSGYLNTATVTSTSNDPVLENNTATAAQPPTFLTIAKSSSADSFTSSASTGAYTLTVTKNGTYVNLGVITVSDALPAGVEATAISSSAGWTCSSPSAFPSTQAVICSRTDEITSNPPLLPAAYPPIVVDIRFTGVSNPAIINRALVTAEREGVVTSFDESSKTVSWTNSTTYYDVVATSALPAGGSASCTPTNVESGRDSTCTATPNTGYRFTGWTGDCASFTTNTSCSLTTITANKTSVAQFEPITYTVVATVGAGGGGTASCTPSPVNHDSSSTCTAAPSTGYRFTGWTGDCASFTTNTSCSLTSITANKTSVAQFEPITYTVVATVGAGGGGTASCTPSPVNHGSSSTCTAAPSTGYRFTGWTGDCASFTTSTSCSLTSITANKTSVAQFELVPTFPAAATVSSGNGTANCSPTTVPSGGTTTCTATPGTGSAFTGWTGACAGQGPVCTLTNVTTAVASVAAFALAAVTPESIPTLSEWAMILLAFLIGLSTFFTLRRRKI